MDVSPPNKESNSKPVIITVREPKCTRCRNHGMIAKMKGHKGSCPYVLCTCIKCILVEERRRISRQQIRLRRHGNIDIQELLECPARIPVSGHQGNSVSPNNLVSDEPGPLCSSMTWPVNFAVGPPQPNPSRLHSTSAAQSDLGHYHSPQNAHLPASYNPNSGNSMIAESHGANLYYPPNKLSDFTPPYAHTPSSYQLTSAPTQNLAYKGFNSGPASSCSRSWFFNSVSYNLNPVTQRITNSRVGSFQGLRCLGSWPESGTADCPTDLTEHSSSEACKLVNDNDK